MVNGAPPWSGRVWLQRALPRALARTKQSIQLHICLRLLVRLLPLLLLLLPQRDGHMGLFLNGAVGGDGSVCPLPFKCVVY